MKPYNREGSNKGEEVREMFDNIAESYDKLNHILSLQIDKVWRRRVVRFVRRKVGGKVCEPIRLLDVATGTGDLAIALSKALPSASVLGIDPSQGMLDVAQKKVAQMGLGAAISFDQQSAELLKLSSNCYDAVTAAFGVRNFSNLEVGMREMIRVTRPGGWVVVLEFSTPRNKLIRWSYDLYSHHLLPRIGEMLSKDRAAYEYLPSSIEEFAQRDEFLALMKSLGLVKCRARAQSFGVAQIYVGRKREI